VFFLIPPLATHLLAGVEVSPRVEARLGAIARDVPIGVIVFQGK